MTGVQMTTVVVQPDVAISFDNRFHLPGEHITLAKPGAAESWLSKGHVREATAEEIAAAEAVG